MFRRKRINEETVEILSKENKKLQRENYRLKESLHELDKYKDEYAKLIEKVKKVKSEYTEKIKEFDDIEKEYKKELDRITKKGK